MMNAIIHNGKRCQIYNDDLELSQLTKFIAEKFPKMKKDARISFKDLSGNNVPIIDAKDMERLKDMYKGQNFVELILEGA